MSEQEQNAEDTTSTGDAEEFEELDEEKLDQEIVEYWESVRARAKIGRLPVVLGVGAEAVLAPQAWSFGDNPRLADELLGHVLSGRKTGTSTALAEFDVDDAMPVVGELSILLDGAGHPRALIRTTSVEPIVFKNVSAEFAASEGEDDLSLESWRREHEVYWRRVLQDGQFSEAMIVVCERFELIDPLP